MNIDAIKKWLWRYRDAGREIDRLQLLLDEVKANSDGVRAIQYSDMPKSHGVGGDLSDTIVRYEKLSIRITQERVRQADVMEEITLAISQIDKAIERWILSLRYIQLMKWEKIAEETGYSEQRIYEIHGEALRYLGRIIEKQRESE